MVPFFKPIYWFDLNTLQGAVFTAEEKVYKPFYAEIFKG